MDLPRPAADDSPSRSWPVRLLRVVKLLLTVILLAIAVWRALIGPIPTGIGP